MDDSVERPGGSNRTVWLLLSYAWIAACCVFLPAIPLIVEQEDEFAKWHARHGLVIALGWFGISFVLLGLANLIGMGWEAGQTIFYIVWALAGVGVLVLCVVAMMKAFEGQRWTLKPLEAVLAKLNF